MNTYKTTMKRAGLCTLALATVAATASAQQYRVAWMRTNANIDTKLDTARTGLVNSQGKFVVAGAAIQANGDHEANVTIFSRDWTFLDDVSLTFATGTNAEFYKIIQVGAFYYAAARYRANGAPNDQILIAKFDLALNKVAERIITATPGAGNEQPTDMVMDANGNLYVCGIATHGAGFENFLIRVNSNLNAHLNFNIGQLTPTFMKPTLATNGIIAILIGLLTSAGPRIQSYSSVGALNYDWGLAYGAGYSNFMFALSDTVVNGFAYMSTASTLENPPGTFTSYGAVNRVNANAGVLVNQSVLPSTPGVGQIKPRVLVNGLPAAKRVNALFDRGNRPTVYSMTDILGPTTSWQSTVAFDWSSGLVVDKWGGTYLSAASPAPAGNSMMAKLSPSNIYQFGWPAPQAGFLLPFMEQSNIYDERSGDILTLKTDNNRMQLTCVKQAPITAPESFVVHSGVPFSPPSSVFGNDRYWGDAVVSIAVPPNHGTVSINAFGYFTYTSNNGFVGADTFTYRLVKPGLTQSGATISLDVKP